MIDNIHRLRNVINKWLFIGDHEWLDIILACALDRRISGDPLWLFVIAVPSGSKTEILRALEEGKRFFHLSSLTTNSLVSGYFQTDSKGNTKKVEDLATQLDGKVLILKDFTSILSMAKEKRDEIIGQLREFYDGSYEKKFGNIDKKITIKSSFGLIGAVTPKVDQYHSIMGALGERFLKLRSDFNAERMLDMCDKNEGKETEMRAELKKAFTEFFDNVEIINVKFSREHKGKIRRMANLLVELRAPSYERWQGDELVAYIPPKPEKPARVYKQLKKLTKLLCCIHKTEWPNDEVFSRIMRVALDSAPPDRLRVYRYLAENGNSSQTDVANGTNMPQPSVRRILRMLKEVGLIEGVGQDVYRNEYWIDKRYGGLLRLWNIVPGTQDRVYVPKGTEEEDVRED